MVGCAGPSHTCCCTGSSVGTALQVHKTESMLFAYVHKHTPLQGLQQAIIVWAPTRSQHTECAWEQAGALSAVTGCQTTLLLLLT
jgi:hypothetical protein